jgi:putative salt-induced outer membrane protein
MARALNGRGAEVLFVSVPMTRVLFVAMLVLIAASSVSAQPAPPPPPPRFESTTQFGLLSTSGNTDTRSITLGGDLTWRPNPWVYSGKLTFAQNEDEGVLKARSLDGRARGARTFTPRLSAFGQYGYLRDTFAGIEHRHTIEGGLSYLALERGPHRLVVDGALGYVREIRLDAEDVGSMAFIGGAAYRWKFSETSELSDEVRFTLPIPDGEEWKGDHQIALTAALTSLLSLRLSNIIRYSNDPVPTFEKTDSITSVTLVMKISRPSR